MKKLSQLITFFSKIAGAKGSKRPEAKISIDMNGYSQPHVLQQRMREQSLKHGDMVLADIGPVRVEPQYDRVTNSYNKRIIYFCPMHYVTVKEKLASGDGERLPMEATVDLTFPTSLEGGIYNLKNVKLYSNGTLQVIATQKTEWEAWK